VREEAQKIETQKTDVSGRHERVGGSVAQSLGPASKTTHGRFQP